MKCNLCPRECGVDRNTDTGWCKMGKSAMVAKVMLHHWEEPPISGERGSGAIFFSGCSLRCVYCQNKDISRGQVGKPYTAADLAGEMLRLQDMGAHNVNLVTPTHFSDVIRDAIDLIRDKLTIPVVYNTSGYEKPSEIAKMAGYVDVFLTDMKYFSPVYSQKYSHAPDYFAVAKESLGRMLEISPECVFNEDGTMKKGVIVRHLVLPSLRRDSIAVLEELSREFDTKSFKLSLMAQYTPEFCDEGYPELARKITTFEYNSVVDKALELGYDGYIQDKSASSVKYTPNFKED